MIRLSSNWCSAGCPSLHHPRTGGLQCVFKPVVQATGPTLPEFNRLRLHAEATPKRRQRDSAVTELRFDLRPLHFEHLARSDDRALCRRPRRQLTGGVCVKVSSDRGGIGVEPFLPSMVWALALVVLFTPLGDWKTRLSVAAWLRRSTSC